MLKLYDVPGTCALGIRGLRLCYARPRRFSAESAEFCAECAANPRFRAPICAEIKTFHERPG
jgi:hypothetical protein